MAFKVYQKLPSGKYQLVDNNFSLAGYNNLIRHIWTCIGEPENGWTVQESQISLQIRNQFKSSNDHILIIPTIHYDVVVKEIWGWTHKDPSTKNVEWTPLLFVYQSIQFLNNTNEGMDEFDISIKNKEYDYEFMYLKGDWNWPRGPHISPILDLTSYGWLKKGFR